MDFVITWVNGGDPEWLKKYKKYKYEDDKSTHPARFRDWDNLQYWFRGVEKFAPWVNKIHFVTWGHLPEWLNTNHPKLKVVKHEDFIPEKYLPTFNSRTIELNLHRIKGLSEEYVNFNDDIFLISLIQKQIFFKNGLPRDNANLRVLTGDDFHLSLFRNTSLVNRHFSLSQTIRQQPLKWFNFKKPIKNNLKNFILLIGGRGSFSGFDNPHLHQPCLKSSLEELWEKEYSVMNESCENRFRNYLTVNPYVLRYWQFASNNFYPINMKKLGEDFRLQNASLQQVSKFIEGQKKPLICINDHVDMEYDFTEAKEKINAAFDRILPEKSAFEKE